MIEYVKHFPPKLNQLAFSQLRPLDHREVGVVESWSNHYIATEIPKTSHRNDKRRSIKPAIRSAENLNWTSHIRSDRVVCSRERSVIDHDVHRIAALRLDDRR